MRDATTFETRLATALGRYAELAPGMDDLEVAERAIAAGRPSDLLGRLADLRRGLASAFAAPTGARLAYLMVILALLLAAVLVAVAVGVFRTEFVRPLAANGAIVFSAGGNNHEAIVTHMVRADGTDDHLIDGGRCPAYSADGSVMAAVSYEGSAYLAVAGADGRPLHKVLLANDPLLSVAFALSPDGHQVVWVKPAGPTAGSASASVELWVAPTSGEQRLDVRIVPAPTVPGAFFDSLAWSPDGRQIAFATFVRDPLTADSTRTAIDVVNVDGSGLRRLTTRPGLLGDSITWSPDGRSLAYTGSADTMIAPPSSPGVTIPPPNDVFVVGADGTGDRNVTTSALTERLPQWSPDGAFIAYLTDGPGDSHHVTTLAVGPSAPGGVPSVGPASDWFVWSPDGRELLWQEITPLGPETFRSTVHAVDPEFKGPARTVKVIDGLIVCTPSWQRLEP